jgi:hypothetical protein
MDIYRLCSVKSVMENTLLDDELGQLSRDSDEATAWKIEESGFDSL